MISSNISGAQAYAAIQGTTGLGAAGLGAAGDDTAAGGETSFGAVLQNAITGLSELGHAADAKSADAISGKGNMTDVVMAVSKAEMALQATVAVRDKVVSAYQDIMRMAV